MEKCWNKNPEERPDFPTLIGQLRDLQAIFSAHKAAWNAAMGASWMEEGEGAQNQAASPRDASAHSSSALSSNASTSSVLSSDAMFSAQSNTGNFSAHWSNAGPSASQSSSAGGSSAQSSSAGVSSAQSNAGHSNFSLTKSVSSSQVNNNNNNSAITFGRNRNASDAGIGKQSVVSAEFSFKREKSTS